MIHVEVLDVNMVGGGPVEGWEKLSWREGFWDGGWVEMEVPGYVLRGALLVPDRFVGVRLDGEDEERVYLIEEVEKVREEGPVRYIVSGRDLSGFFEERQVVPPAGQSHHRFAAGVAVESALRSYVDAHVGPGADSFSVTIGGVTGAVPSRRLPQVVVAASQGLPATLPEAVEARFQSLGAVMRWTAMPAGYGWRVRKPVDDAELVFTVREGQDRSDEVVVTADEDVVAKLQMIQSKLESKNVILAAGQGEGTARTTMWRYQGSQPSGWRRRETYADMRDLDNTSAMRQRSDARLVELAESTSVIAELYASDVGLTLGEDFDVGDLLTVTDEEMMVDEPIRCLGARYDADGTEGTLRVTAEIGPPWPEAEQLEETEDGTAVS